MRFQFIQFEIEDGVAEIVLNRPDAINTVNRDLVEELDDATRRAAHDPTVRAILVRGEGKVFSGGGDLKSFLDEGENLPQYAEQVIGHLHAAISRLIRGKSPVVTAVHGSAAGGGMSLALAGDIVLAGESARFMMAYTRAGLTPDGSSTYTLPRLVGLRRALELTLLNRVLSAKEALDWGLITRVVPDPDLETESRALAQQLAQGPTTAIAAARRLLYDGWNETLETQMEREGLAFVENARCYDCREGIQAFLEKRKPEFRGE